MLIKLYIYGENQARGGQMGAMRANVFGWVQWGAGIQGGTKISKEESFSSSHKRIHDFGSHQPTHLIDYVLALKYAGLDMHIMSIVSYTTAG